MQSKNTAEKFTDRIEDVLLKRRYLSHEQQRNALIMQARKHATKIVSEAENEAQEVYSQAYITGYERGMLKALD